MHFIEVYDVIHMWGDLHSRPSGSWDFYVNLDDSEIKQHLKVDYHIMLF